MSLFDDMDFEGLKDEIAGILEDALEDVVEGAREDLQSFARVIASDLVTAIKADRPDLRRELIGQARMVAEINRIRLNREARAVLSRVLEVAARVGKVLLTAAVAAV